MSIQKINSNTLADGAVLNSIASSVNFRNRIINGDMRIDQRNAGASVANNGYAVDRFLTFRDGASVAISAQRSTVAPVGFTNSLLHTTTTAGTQGSAEAVGVQQRVEGFNVADLGWGTANAQAVTLSFWTRSSLTGTFSGSVTNSAFNRSYPFTYSISAANTWEYKTITIPGDTTGTWLTDNGIGLRVYWDMGSGSIVRGTAGAWAGAGLVGATGAVSVVGTSGATFYITGVQLEAGSVATPFERRPFGTELQLCQRYYEVLPAWADTRNIVNTSNGFPFNTQLQFKVTKRAIPTMTARNVDTIFSLLVFGGISVEGCIFGAAQDSTGAAQTSYIYVNGGFTAAIEL
jgi:hypothetical protein